MIKRIFFVLILIIFLVGCSKKYEIVFISQEGINSKLDFECVKNSFGLKYCEAQYSGCSRAYEMVFCHDTFNHTESIKRNNFSLICDDKFTLKDLCFKQINYCLARFSTDWKNNECKLINESKYNEYFI